MMFRVLWRLLAPTPHRKRSIARMPSTAGVASAAARAADFGVSGRASFVVGDLVDTGLGSASADGAVCADAVFVARDRVAVFTEVARVLRPGARFAFTADENNDLGRPGAVPDWVPTIEAGGLLVDKPEEIPGWGEDLQRMYRTWIANIDEVRTTLGPDSAQDLLDEAARVGPTLATRTGVLYTTRKPEMHPAPASAT